MGVTTLDVRRLAFLHQPPAPFTPGDAVMWTDPHVARQMLAAHLDPDIDAASRRPAVIECSVAWLLAQIPLSRGQKVLDLGCGPGLYASRLAQHGLAVTGIDISRTSIDHATHAAQEQRLAIDYRCGDYLAMEPGPRFDAILLIYGDFCTHGPSSRARLLSFIQRSLAKGGRFVLDVTTLAQAGQRQERRTWSAHPHGGFWHPQAHLVLEQGFSYPGAVHLDQWVVVDEHATVRVYRNSYQDYSRESLVTELHAAGFAVQGVWRDLTGAPYDPASGWMAVIAEPRVHHEG